MMESINTMFTIITDCRECKMKMKMIKKDKRMKWVCENKKCVRYGEEQQSEIIWHMAEIDEHQ